MTTIIVEPVADRPGYFRAWCRDRQIVAASRQPFLDAARAFVAAGGDADAMLVMRHIGSTTDALRAVAKIAARLTVAEEAFAPPRFRRWKPYPHSREGVQFMALSECTLSVEAE